MAGTTVGSIHQLRVKHLNVFHRRPVSGDGNFVGTWVPSGSGFTTMQRRLRRNCECRQAHWPAPQCLADPRTQSGTSAMQHQSQRSHSGFDASSALRALDPGVHREAWIRILTAAKAAGISLDEAIDWSSPAANFEGASTVKAVWKSIKADGGIRAGTLYYLAREVGWTAAEPTLAPRPPRSDFRNTESQAVQVSSSARELWESFPAAGRPSIHRIETWFARRPTSSAGDLQEGRCRPAAHRLPRGTSEPAWFDNAKLDPVHPAPWFRKEGKPCPGHPCKARSLSAT
ncbi:MAG: PriCT-2 domain-containing protein [Ideonella sp.]|nr:PriCT-2 domain-containing protein [Ideonella sp.]